MLNKLFFIWAVIVFVIPIPLVLITHVVARLYPEHNRLIFIYKAHRMWIKWWETLTGIHFHVHKHELIDPQQTYVFVCNHCNILDIPIVGSTIIHPWKSLVKRELLNVPFVGWIIGQISIPVDRGDKASRKKSLLQMIQELNDGVSVLIFPEGTRNRTEEPLKRFHPGAFSVAISAQVPIMPIILSETRPLQPIDTIEFHPGHGHLTFLPPISTEGYTEKDVATLMNQVHETMSQALIALDPQFQIVANGGDQNAEEIMA